MGTRGFIGFVVDGTEKVAYSHWDSYPGGLGVDVLTWLRTAVTDPDGLRESVRALRVVDPKSEATDEDVERLRQFADPDVASRDLHDWYVLLRHTQGNPDLMLQAGVIEDAGTFPADSLYAEWGYMVDLDARTFEAFRGFQVEPHKRGRFADRPVEKYSISTQYHPVALVGSWPLSGLPNDEMFCESIDPTTKDED